MLYNGIQIFLCYLIIYEVFNSVTTTTMESYITFFLSSSSGIYTYADDIDDVLLNRELSSTRCYRDLLSTLLTLLLRYRCTDSYTRNFNAR